MKCKTISFENKHNCTIIVDTNQFVSDFSLSSIRWKNLIDYLAKTESSLRMPRVVWDELHVNFENRLKESIKKLDDATDQYNRIINFNSETHGFRGREHCLKVREGTHSPSEIAERYLAHVKNKLGLGKGAFLQIETKWYDDIYKRALVHKKPFSDDSDKGFKDSLLWKSMISLAKKPGYADAPVVFISSNTKDFCASKGASELHPDLNREAESVGLNVVFFDGLDSFFRGWSAEALDMDFVALNKEIDEKLLRSAVLPYASKFMVKEYCSENNVNITGMNFKVGVVDGSRKVVDLSISGYLTETILPCRYMDFTAEASVILDRGSKMVNVFSFTLIPLKSEQGWG